MSTSDNPEMAERDLLKFAAAVATIAAVLVLAGWRLYERSEWWAIVLLEIAGALTGGVVIFVLIRALTRAHDRRVRAIQLAPVQTVYSERLKSSLDGVYTTVSQLADVLWSADWYSEPSERLLRLQSTLREQTPGRGPMVDIIQEHYPSLRDVVMRCSDACLPLAQILDPPGRLVADLAALEKAGAHDMQALYRMSGRVPEDYDAWPELQDHLLSVIDAALVLADGIPATIEPQEHDDDQTTAPAASPG